MSEAPPIRPEMPSPEIPGLYRTVKPFTPGMLQGRLDATLQEISFQEAQDAAAAELLRITPPVVEAAPLPEDIATEQVALSGLRKVFGRYTQWRLGRAEARVSEDEPKIKGRELRNSDKLYWLADGWSPKNKATDLANWPTNIDMGTPQAKERIKQTYEGSARRKGVKINKRYAKIQNGTGIINSVRNNRHSRHEYKVAVHNATKYHNDYMASHPKPPQEQGYGLKDAAVDMGHSINKNARIAGRGAKRAAIVTGKAAGKVASKTAEYGVKAAKIGGRAAKAGAKAADNKIAEHVINTKTAYREGEAGIETVDNAVQRRINKIARNLGRRAARR